MSWQPSAEDVRRVLETLSRLRWCPHKPFPKQAAFLTLTADAGGRLEVPA